jgi:F-box and WD-40 domain protein 1/11
MTGHARGIACLQFDGRIAVSGSNDRSVKVWDVETGQCIQTLTGHSNLVRCLAFRGRRLISGSYDHSIKFWDVREGQCMLDYRAAHDSWVFDVQCDLTKMVTSGQDHRVLVWDFGAGLELDDFWTKS